MDGPTKRGTFKYTPPEQSVRRILGDHALQHEPPDLNVRQEIKNLSKFRANRKGRIRVSKEVLAILKQVSTDLDSAQKHYLAYKQFGDAAESILKLSPELFTLPHGGSEATEEGDEQQDGSAAESAGPSRRRTMEAEYQDPLVGHRRWGYMPMLKNLRAGSARSRRPTQSAKRLADSTDPAAIAAALQSIPADPDDCDDFDMPDSPQTNWADLMKKKKQAKEDGIAQTVRLRHAALIIQRAWRAHLKRRASKALSMMMLRQKVRRAHNAIYVSNLLRHKGPGMGSSSGGSTGDDCELTPEQEAFVQEEVQRLLEMGQLKAEDLADLQPTGVLTAAEANECEEGQQDERTQQQHDKHRGWKLLSNLRIAIRKPQGLRVDTDPSAISWRESLRTTMSGHTTSRCSVDVMSPNSSTGSASPKTSGCGGLLSPKSARRSRSAAGVKVGKNMSVVLARADNAVAVANGSGDVSFRAKTAARKSRHSSRLNPTAGSTDAAANTDTQQYLYDSADGSNVGSPLSGDGSSIGSPMSPGAAGPQHAMSPRHRSSTSSSTRGLSKASMQAMTASIHNATPGANRVRFSGDAAADIETIGAPACGDNSSEAAAMASARNIAAAVEARGFSDIGAALAGDLAAINAAATDMHGQRINASVGGLSLGTRTNMTDGSSRQMQVDYLTGFDWKQQATQQQQQSQQDRAGNTLPGVLIQLLAAAADQAGLKAGTPEWQQAMEQMQQYAVEEIMQRQLGWMQQHSGDGAARGNTEGTLSAADSAEAALIATLSGDGGIPSLLSLSEAPAMAAAAAAAASAAILGSQDGSGRQYAPNYGSCATSQDPAAAAMYHYASPFPPRTGSPGRRSRCGSSEYCHEAADGSGDGMANGRAASRRATREGSLVDKSFKTTFVSGGSFSKYERGLSDGLPQDYRNLAAEAVLAPARSHSPPHKQRTRGSFSGDGFGQSSQVDHQVQGNLHQSGGVADALVGMDGLVQMSDVQQLLMLEQQLWAAGQEQGLGPNEGPFVSNGDGSSHAVDHFDSSGSAAFDYAAAAATVAAGMERYKLAAAAAATAASGQPGPLMQGLMLGPGGVWHQIQQQSRADAWYARLKAHHKDQRQPWDVAGGFNRQQPGPGYRAQPDALQGPGSEGSVEFPSGRWGRRGNVRNAWLFIDGQAASALPWQALAAATMADGGCDSCNVVAAPDELAGSAAFDAAAAVMESEDGSSSLSQLSVKGRKMLIKLMWLKSTASVLRGLGHTYGLSQILDRKVLQLLRQQIGPAGQELLQWSLEDQKQQIQMQLGEHVQRLRQLLAQQPHMQHLAQPINMLTTVLDSGLDAVGMQRVLLPYQLPGFSKGAVPAQAICQQFSGDLLGQNLPLLPAARARGFISRHATDTPQQLQLQQQQQQLLQLLAQQRQQLLLAQQQGQQQQASCDSSQQRVGQLGASPAAACAMDFEPLDRRSPVQMRQLLSPQQQPLCRQQFQNHRQQQQPQPGLLSESSQQFDGSVQDGLMQVPMVRKVVLMRRSGVGAAAATDRSAVQPPAAVASAESGTANISPATSLPAGGDSSRRANGVLTSHSCDIPSTQLLLSVSSQVFQAQAGQGQQVIEVQQHQQATQQKQLPPLKEDLSGRQLRWQDGAKPTAGATAALLQQQQQQWQDGTHQIGEPEQSSSKTARLQQHKLPQQQLNLAPQQGAADASEEPSGPAFLCFAASTRFQQRVQQKPRRRTDGGLMPCQIMVTGSTPSSVVTGGAGAYSARQNSRHMSNIGVDASAAVQVHNIQLGQVAPSNLQALQTPAVVASALGCKGGFLAAQQQLLQQQQQEDREGYGPALVQVQQRQRPGELQRRLSASDPGSAALLADIKAAAATCSSVDANLQQQASPSLAKRLAPSGGIAGPSVQKQLRAVQSIGRSSSFPVSVIGSGNNSSSVFSGSVMHNPVAQQAIALHQALPQLPQLAPLRVANAAKTVGNATARTLEIKGASSRQLLPTLVPGRSDAAQH